MLTAWASYAKPAPRTQSFKPRYFDLAKPSNQDNFLTAECLIDALKIGASRRNFRKKMLGFVEAVKFQESNYMELVDALTVLDHEPVA